MKKQPNILIVMTDHQRGDTALPGHIAKTPNLDRLAAAGITFTNAFCPSPHCCPARATFMSGLYPSRHGVWNNVCNEQALSRGLNPDVKLWSEDLAAAGYEMHYAGKWHVSSLETPEDRGWHEYDVSGCKFNEHSTQWSAYQKLRERTAGTQREEGEIIRPGYPPYKLYNTLDSELGNPHDVKVTEQALAALDKLADSENPWCLYAGFIGPHDPYSVPKKFVDMYDLEDIKLPENFKDEMADKPYIYRRIRNIFGQLSEKEIREGIRHFWAYCTYLDDLFGKIISRLDKKGLAEDTLVLFVSDHGDYCGEHGLFTKGVAAFKGAYHVPAVIRWPNGIKAPGKQYDQFVSLADFAPTFVELAGIKTDRYFTGSSLVPFFNDAPPEDWRDEIHTQLNGVELYYTQRSVRTSEYRYVFNGFDRDELYDLKQDPNEMKNLADEPAYENIKKEMCRRLWEFAEKEKDGAINSYITVGLAPYGPGIIFEN